ncbi:P-loop containing nucleoside triphosphate hydrolase protein [Lophiostoma macrostomum CBS 122681]|uniref:ATP-dependent RNA helicase ROK1 n=1 Tax=Lophiostoma macrostomum CBS 122681 TaxID=1314788 RepID=A0A6A6ST68_9PLEO|nr:P-loop containing nucleoside triphosphate hydrolase protein [Lophiostoma macrostomum CBS 122681]
MDVFKLLSRTSKATPAPSSQKLPSSGAVANPQLFGRDAAEGPHANARKSRKRKRGQDKTDLPAELPVALDFFGGASQPAQHTEKPTQKGRGQGTKSEQHQDGALETASPEDMEESAAEEDYDEDERKRILRAHKLKIVILEDYKVQEIDSRDRGKEKKKRKKDKVEKIERDAKAKKKERKKEKKQLFPRPLTDFAQLRTAYGISPRLAENIKEQGYKVPTEVQLGALPLLLSKRRDGGRSEISSTNGHDSADTDVGGDFDLLTVAPTGSGKTIAFLIPIINSLLSEEKASSNAKGPRAVIIAPTKELASQIVNEARKLARGTGIKATLMRKGVEVVKRPEEDIEDDVDTLGTSSEEDRSASDSEAGKRTAKKPKGRRRRADVVKAAILVATPLALLNALKQQGGEVSQLPSIRHLVLDEADVLLDPLFCEQTLAIWTACTSPLLRVGLWSATMGSNIEDLTMQTLNSRWTSLASSATESLPPRHPLIRLVVGLRDTAIPNITHKLIYAATEQGKLLGLRQLLHPTATASSETTPWLLPPFLIFTQTIPRAIALHSELLYDIPPEAGGSSRIAVLHADLSSSAREAIMTRFRRGEIWVLITTDLLARGVDFRGLNGVVNYDVPNSAAAYVHRVGRTGRAGREGGVAVTFYTKEDIPYIKNVANVIRASENLRGTKSGDGEGEVGGGESIKGWLLDALPTPTKREKQMLKKRGVEARRRVKDDGGKGTMRISTKSGYDRRRDNNLQGAKSASRGRVDGGAGPRAGKVDMGSESDFEGFGE